MIKFQNATLILNVYLRWKVSFLLHGNIYLQLHKKIVAYNLHAKFCLNEFKETPDSSVEFFFLFRQKQDRNLNILLSGMIFLSYFLKHIVTCKWQFRISIFLFFRAHLWKDSFPLPFCDVDCDVSTSNTLSIDLSWIFFDKYLPAQPRQFVCTSEGMFIYAAARKTFLSKWIAFIC